MLNYKKIGKHAQRITKIKPFISEFKWEGINFLSERDNWKKYEKNNAATFLNVLYAKKENLSPAYVSKNNSNWEKQVIILIIQNGEGRWHYLATKKSSIIKRKNIKKER